MPDTPAPNRWLIPFLFAGFAGCLAVVVWLTLDHFGIRFGVWPFSSVITIGLLAGLSGFVFGRAYQQQKLAREAANDDPIEDDDYDTSTDENLPPMPIFADRVRIARRRTENVNGVEVEVFDLTTETSDGDGGTVRITRTFALMPAMGLPGFKMRPLQFQDRLIALAGALGLTFDINSLDTLDEREVLGQFVKTYRLTAVSAETMIAGTVDIDENAVRKVFPLKVMQTILARPDWSVQSHGGYLVCWVASDALGPKRRARLVTDAVSLRAVFLKALAGEAGNPIAAPSGTKPLQQQSARLQASLLGGVIGVFLGFFAGVLLHVGEVFGDGNRPEVFLTAILCGGFLGALIGRSLPLRKPLLQKPKDERREKVVGCAILFGLFGGFLGGSIVGIIIGEVIGLQIGEHKKRQLLVFGSMGAGAFLGPVVLGVTTNFIYKRLFRKRTPSTQPESDQGQ